jgi:hypothetical protein
MDLADLLRRYAGTSLQPTNSHGSQGRIATDLPAAEIDEALVTQESEPSAQLAQPLCGDQPVSAAPKIHEDGVPLSLSHNSPDSHNRLPRPNAGNGVTTGSTAPSDAHALTADPPPAMAHDSPTPDHERGALCPICGSRDKWSWVDGRELCRCCLRQDTDPVAAVKVFSPILGGHVWVVDSTLPREAWPTAAPVYTHTEVMLLTQVGPETLASVHLAKELFGARVIDARIPQEKGETANR